MPTKNQLISQRIYASQVRRLQRAGLLKNVDPSKHGTPAIYAVMAKNRDLLSGRASVLQAPSQAKARELRLKHDLRGSGSTLIIPREKGERFRITRKGEIKSTREIFGETVHKTIAGKISRPKPGQKLYYTIKRKRGFTPIRKTFSSFDELEHWLATDSGGGLSYEDIESYIEVEEFKEGGKRDRQMREKISRERRRAINKLKRKRIRHAKRRGR